MQGQIIKTQMLENTEIIICKDHAVETVEEKITILTELKKKIYEIKTNKVIN